MMMAASAQARKLQHPHGGVHILVLSRIEPRTGGCYGAAGQDER